MSVKPILFNTEMVQAILDGRKTVTRRCVKPQPSKVRDITIKEDNKGKYVWGYVDYGDSVAIKDIPFPYQPGDIIYVRETWSDHYVPDDHGKPNLEYCYKADGTDIKGECLPGENNRWYPSIHMPKEAARIWLKVTDVRVERLQNMNVHDAIAEGALRYPEEWIWKEAFQNLWDSTIPKHDLDKYGWNANPWVWVIEFERTVKPEC